MNAIATSTHLKAIIIHLTHTVKNLISEDLTYKGSPHCPFSHNFFAFTAGFDLPRDLFHEVYTRVHHLLWPE